MSKKDVDIDIREWRKPRLIKKLAKSFRALYLFTKKDIYKKGRINYYAIDKFLAELRQEIINQLREYS